VQTSSILIVHNYYQQPGGEDQVFANEAALLEGRGHRVIRYEEHNSRIGNGNAAGAAVDAVWSSKSARSLTELVRKHKPDVAHFHNTFPLISPAAHYAVQREGVPVVQTLHNYRLLCPNATLFRDGAVCEECVERQSLLPAIRHGCYRGSRRATTAVATMLSVHRAAGTWQREVDVYIAVSEFARRKFIEGGLPASRIVVKRNFVAPDPGVGAGAGGYAMFAGRLSAEKGIGVLASAWRELSDIPLVVVGEGPLAGVFAESSVERLKPVPAVATHGAAPQAEVQGAALLGRQPREKFLSLMSEARVLIFPSVWYEGAPGTIAEAFACGLPVIASNLGAMAEMVDHERTGLLFEPGDGADLACKVRWAFEHPEAVDAMRVEARREFEEKYTADRNYEELMAIYETAIANKKRARRAAS
jgi:glycosyltransferase involved in cell wall biosynthesis